MLENEGDVAWSILDRDALELSHLAVKNPLGSDVFMSTESVVLGNAGGTHHISGETPAL